jgi:hypothetical protein
MFAVRQMLSVVVSAVVVVIVALVLKTARNVYYRDYNRSNLAELL